MGERTLLVIKPCAVRRGLVGEIISRVEREGFKIVRGAFRRLTKEEAERFYEVHRGKPFFPQLIEFITSGPVMGLELEAPDAIRRLRQLMGATNPAEAAPGTLRALYGVDITQNAVHGSDSPESARHELEVFFGGWPWPT